MIQVGFYHPQKYSGSRCYYCNTCAFHQHAIQILLPCLHSSLPIMSYTMWYCHPSMQVWDVHTLQDKGILTGCNSHLLLYMWHHHPHVYIISGHVGAVYAVAVLRAPGRDRLFSASYDKTIRVRCSLSHPHVGSFYGYRLHNQ